MRGWPVFKASHFRKPSKASISHFPWRWMSKERHARVGELGVLITHETSPWHDAGSTRPGWMPPQVQVSTSKRWRLPLLCGCCSLSVKWSTVSLQIINTLKAYAPFIPVRFRIRNPGLSDRLSVRHAFLCPNVTPSHLPAKSFTRLHLFRRPNPAYTNLIWGIETWLVGYLYKVWFKKNIMSPESNLCEHYAPCIWSPASFLLKRSGRNSPSSPEKAGIRNLTKTVVQG